MTERKQWRGWGGGEPEANNLVYTKRQKDIYAIRKHETARKPAKLGQGKLLYLVTKASGSPNPRKYGQWFSTFASLLCSSRPWLNHLYSKQYRAFRRHRWTILAV